MPSAYKFGTLRSNVEPVGTKDGVNDAFSLPDDDKCVAGSLMVYLNGVLYRPGSITVNGDKKGFVINDGDNLPTSTDDLTVTYITSNK